MLARPRLLRAYDPESEVDVVGFSGSLVVYALSVAGSVAVSRVAGRGLPDRYAVSDLALGGVATHKLSRLVTKSSVAAPLRAPFTTFEGPAGSGEHHESPRGSHGPRHAVGELITCPFCLAVWIASAYVVGLVVAPRATRTAAAVLSVVATSDTLQQVYARLRED